LIAYVALPELHQPVFGKITMAFVVTLFAAYLFMTINAFAGLALIKLHVECQIVSFLIQVRLEELSVYFISVYDLFSIQAFRDR
jgi:hypothetical protein